MDNTTAPATTEQLPDIIDRIMAWWITSGLDEGASLSSGVMMIPNTEYRRERLTTWIREMGRPAAIAALRAHAKSPAEIAAQEQADGDSTPQAEVRATGFLVVDNGDAYEAEGGDTFWRECFCTDGKHAEAHRRDRTDDVHQAMTWARNSGAHVLELQAYVVVIELQL